MPKYESQTRALRKYRETHYDSISLRLPKGAKAELAALADADGVSLNRYIADAVEKKSRLKLTLGEPLTGLK